MTDHISIFFCTSAKKRSLSVLRWSVIGCKTSRTMKFNLIDSSGNPDEQIQTRVRYILKRADDKTRLFFNIDTKYDLGPTTGSKAIGVSQAIGENTRKRTGGVQSSGCRGVSAEMLEAATISNLERSSHDCC